MEKHPNIQAILAHIQSAWNYQKRFIVNGERQRFLNQSMVVLLNIGGNCSCLRAKVAHMVVNGLNLRRNLVIALKVRRNSLQ